MEKLQEALRKARAQRATQSGPAPTSKAPATAPAISGKVPTPASGDIEAAWNSLSRVDPKLAGRNRSRIIALEGHGEAMHYDMLRTKVLQATKAHGWRRIVVTSAGPGSGKTTTALNLAASLSRNGEMRVMLFDVDLRRPALAKALSLKGTNSTGDVLAGRVDFADQAVLVAPNFAVSVNHSSFAHAAELLMSERVGAILKSIEAKYAPDIMIFDMPPYFANDDTNAFLKNVDCGLIIAEAEHTSVAQVDRCEKEMSEQTNILGIVLNKCRFKDETYGYESY